jgi:hypothetical protein
MYASSNITSCSVPPPAACKITVELLGINIASAILQSATSGWRSCTKFNVNTPGWTCNYSFAPNEFYTQQSLTIETPGGNYGSSATASTTVSYHCHV